MLHTSGIQPKLDGRECEELIGQQYWQSGKLINEIDVLFIKSHAKWHEIYFENSTIYWRQCLEKPEPVESKESDLFHYPLVDLGNKYKVKGQIITKCESEPLANGSKISFEFENGDKIVVRCEENETRLHHIKAA